MSKTHDTLNVGYGAPKDPDALKEHRTLDDAELEAVSGGIAVTKHSDVSGFSIDIGTTEMIVVTKPTDAPSCPSLMNR